MLLNILCVTLGLDHRCHANTTAHRGLLFPSIQSVSSSVITRKLWHMVCGLAKCHL